MKRWVIISLVGLALFIGLGLLLTLIPKLRKNAADVACKNNLREVGLFAALNADPNADRSKVSTQIPAGTIVNPALPWDQRLSWYVSALPGFNQQRQNVDALLAGIDRDQPWFVEKNHPAAKTRLVALLCPGNPPEIAADGPAPTCYVGIGGRGRDAAALPPHDPRAGCYRYDAPTPFATITDGLSQTLLLGERSGDLGPWLQGGPASVRGLDDAPDAARLQGPGGQFGGNHPDGANWCLADGSVRFFTDKTDPRVLYGMATIAGQGSDPLPGE
jgi:prepilin-type processing-associated H-X9-DG protein